MGIIATFGVIRKLTKIWSLLDSLWLHKTNFVDVNFVASREGGRNSWADGECIFSCHDGTFCLKVLGGQWIFSESVTHTNSCRSACTCSTPFENFPSADKYSTSKEFFSLSVAKGRVVWLMVRLIKRRWTFSRFFFIFLNFSRFLIIFLNFFSIFFNFSQFFLIFLNFFLSSSLYVFLCLSLFLRFCLAFSLSLCPFHFLSVCFAVSFPSHFLTTILSSFTSLFFAFPFSRFPSSTLSLFRLTPFDPQHSIKKLSKWFLKCRSHCSYMPNPLLKSHEKPLTYL